MNKIQTFIKKQAEIILKDVDYDLYKEDLEEREILNDIEYHLKNTLQNICDTFTLDEILNLYNGKQGE